MSFFRVLQKVQEKEEVAHIELFEGCGNWRKRSATMIWNRAELDPHGSFYPYLNDHSISEFTKLKSYQILDR